MNPKLQIKESIILALLLFGSIHNAYSQTDLKFKDPRDGNTYSYVQIDDLYWMSENLSFKSDSAFEIMENGECSYFYNVEEAFEVCPTKWRLPNEKEVKALLKLEKKDKINIADSLGIIHCGRVDNHHHTKYGEQNTFWMDAELVDGHITHWHLFHDGHKIHTHNVVVAKRMFPIRCVRSVE